MFSTPANPTGWVASREDLEALLEFGRERGIWIISDEVYGRLYFEGRVAPSILQIAEPEDLALSVNSFSKAWAMTGWRVGWLTHPASVAPQVAAMTQYMNSGTAGILQAGALAALTKGEELVEEMRERCRNGIELAYAALSQLPEVRLPAKPRGGMYTFFSLAQRSRFRRRLPAHPRHRPRRSRAGLPLRQERRRGHLRMCICRNPVAAAPGAGADGGGARPVNGFH